MMQRMIAMGSGASEEGKNIWLRASDTSSTPYEIMGEYTIGDTISTSPSSSYGAIAIFLKEPMTLYVEGGSSTTRVQYADGTTQKIGNTKTLCANMVAATVVTNGTSLKLSES